MNHYQTLAMVLRRVEYGEADRILTLLTPDHGKVSALAKGVRKVKSKIAGGIELLTINEVTIIEGRGDIKTLRSARMKQHFARIMSDIVRMQLAFRLLKAIDKQTEMEAEAGYFWLAEAMLVGLDNIEIDPSITESWFWINFLYLQGHQPNLNIDVNGKKLSSDKLYVYSASDGALQASRYGHLGEPHIKFARLSLQMEPQNLARIKESETIATEVAKAFEIKK